MISLLILAVVLPVTASFICSLMEATLFSVSNAHLRMAADKGSSSAKLLIRLKNDISKPIAAILIFNTAAATIGAAIAGSVASAYFGAENLLLFSFFFAAAILYFSEITPKFIGVAYSKQIAPFIAYPLLFMIKLVYPLIYVADKISLLFGGQSAHHTISKDEILGMTALGAERGALDQLEGSVISNVIALDKILVKDLLTPRVVVFRLDQDASLIEVQKNITEWTYSRIPIYSLEHPDHLESYVTQKDLYAAIVKDEKNKFVRDFARKLDTVPELMRADNLLIQMLEKNEQICVVVDEHGGFAGIVTLEDILEEIVGKEIVDEYDQASDLRKLAKAKMTNKKNK